jgi:predicted RNA-binding Zn-ribbon protein involved in translation (DUF1610 family)
MSSPTEVEHILSPAPQDVPMADTPSKNLKEGSRPKKPNSRDIELSVFDILNIFRRRWFLSRANLLTNVISAQKAEDGKISWVEFTPQYHSHLVKCAVALVPHPVHKVKKVMFGYILELLNGEGHMAFFELQKGGRKANNAQKEKRRLARKRSRAAKRERDREAAKVAKQPPRERQCVACGRKFNSRKTASKHKCPKSKVERVRKEAVSSQASQATTAAMTDMPPAPPTPHAPTAPSNSNAAPVVTEGSRVIAPPARRVRTARNVQTGERRVPRSEEEWRQLAATGLWRLMDL